MNEKFLKLFNSVGELAEENEVIKDEAISKNYEKIYKIDSIWDIKRELSLLSRDINKWICDYSNSEDIGLSKLIKDDYPYYQWGSRLTNSFNQFNDYEESILNSYVCKDIRTELMNLTSLLMKRQVTFDLNTNPFKKYPLLYGITTYNDVHKKITLKSLLQEEELIKIDDMDKKYSIKLSANNNRLKITVNGYNDILYLHTFPESIEYQWMYYLINILYIKAINFCINSPLLSNNELAISTCKNFQELLLTIENDYTNISEIFTNLKCNMIGPDKDNNILKIPTLAEFLPKLYLEDSKIFYIRKLSSKGNNF